MEYVGSITFMGVINGGIGDVVAIGLRAYVGKHTQLYKHTHRYKHTHTHTQSR